MRALADDVTKLSVHVGIIQNRKKYILLLNTLDCHWNLLSIQNLLYEFSLKYNFININMNKSKIIGIFQTLYFGSIRFQAPRCRWYHHLRLNPPQTYPVRTHRVSASQNIKGFQWKLLYLTVPIIWTSRNVQSYNVQCPSGTRLSFTVESKCKHCRTPRIMSHSM